MDVDDKAKAHCPNRSPRASAPEPVEWAAEVVRPDQRPWPRKPEPKVVLAYPNAQRGYRHP